MLLFGINSDIHTLTTQYNSDIHAQSTVDLGTAVRQGWPFYNQYRMALLWDQGRMIARFEGGDIIIPIEVKWLIVAAAINNTDLRREDFVFWAIDEY